MTTHETPSLRLERFALADVRLLPSRWADAQEAVHRYMRLEDLPRRLMRQFYLISNIDENPIEPLGGPEKPDLHGYRGDFVGHFLSSCAFMAAATGDADLDERAAWMVGELDRCQQALGGGFVAGFPETRLDAAERGMFVRVPYYALHKTMAGLYDQHTLRGNAQALTVLTRLADYILGRIRRVGDEHWRNIVLPIEYGGMLECCLDIYALTGEQRHLELAMKFDEREFFDPISRGEDNLSHRHANTTIPKVVGAARAYLLTGEKRWLAVAENFWRLFTSRRMYCCGGSDHSELWHDPALMPQSLSPVNHEFCCVHNLIKLAGYLLSVTGESRYSDYIERAMVNTVLGTLDPRDGMIRGNMLAMSTGVRKNHSTPYDSFWCCCGTGMETAGSLAQDIFWHDGANQTLAVEQFIPARLEWRQRGMSVEQHTPMPDAARSRLIVRCATPQKFTLQLRLPHWARETLVRLNGTIRDMAAEKRPPWHPESAVVALDRTWADGDVVEIEATMGLCTEPLIGDDQVRAVLCGPVVLAGIVREDRFVHPAADDDCPPAPTPGGAVEDWYLTGPMEAIEKWLRPVGETTLNFRTSGLNQDVLFTPINRVLDEPYGVYWPMLVENTPRLAELQARHEQAWQRYRQRGVDRVVVGNEASEAAHNYEGNSDLAWHAGWANRTGIGNEGGAFAYTMKVLPDVPQAVLVYCFQGQGRGFEVRVDGTAVGSVGIGRTPPCVFQEHEFAIPPELTAGRTQVQVSFHANDEPKGYVGPVYGLAVVRCA
ncbi:MAG: glycoside hydrolase family 127 protein [Planctomycetaceae bacterium]|nr:glycoside hydrolase family 127 protein [Planctomycetaceae bacterium]